MANRQSHINHNILAIGMVDDAGEHFPCVHEGVALKETVQNSISGNLELRSNTQGSTGSLGLPDALNDTLRVALEVESPLVKRARTG